MHHPAFMVVFTTSLFRGAMKDWWVHLRKEYEYIPEEEEEDDKEKDKFDGGPRYRFPDWNAFTKMVRKQFRDPAIELIHEKRLLELKIGSGAAYLFFRRIEREAKLANCLDDQSERSVIVQAV